MAPGISRSGRNAEPAIPETICGPPEFIVEGINFLVEAISAAPGKIGGNPAWRGGKIQQSASRGEGVFLPLFQAFKGAELEQKMTKICEIF